MMGIGINFHKVKIWLAGPGPLTAFQELVGHLIGLLIISTIVFSLSTVVSIVHEKPKEIDLAQRIRVLTESLNAAAETIGEIEDQIRQREILVQKLQEDADTASKLTSMNKEQLDAVAQVLKGQIEKEQHQTFWSAQLLAFFYTILGVILAELYHFIEKRWRRRKLRTAASYPD
jgi:hypothetical protein